jgi:glutamate-1-semialdehyde 2,1-aminomutase
VTGTRMPRNRSRQLDDQARGSLPGGVNSNVRLTTPRVFFERGEGAWLYDVDGNDYVDYLLGQGPSLLGHANHAVHEAVAAATCDGMVFGAQHPREVDAAERFLAATQWPEMVRFGVSGTESVQAALRVARAATGRPRVLRFEGHYHGWLDDLLTGYDAGQPGVASRGQLPSRLADSLVIPWNDADLVREMLEARGDEIAAVLMEPVMLNQGSIPPLPGYLESVRGLCDRHGVVLIFDEVITGFRLALGGAAELYGVTPDLAVYGKAIAAGWPVSALAGSRTLMAPIGTGEVNVSGTFNGSVMTMAAACAAIDQLRMNQPYDRMAAHGQRLMAAIREIATAHGVDVHVQGLPQAFHVSIGRRETPLRDFCDVLAQDVAGYVRLADALVDAGVWVTGRGIWYLSAAHDERAIDVTLDRIDQAFLAYTNTDTSPLPSTTR